MKPVITFFIILISNLFFAATSNAEEENTAAKFSENFYLYFGAIQHYNVSNSVFSKAGVASGNGSSTSSKASSLGLGFHWKDNINIEIELTNGIKLNGDLAVQPANIELDMFSVGALADYPATEMLNLYGKVGISYIKQRTEFLEGNQLNNNTQKEIELFLEGGAEWVLKPETKLRFGYQYTDYSDIQKYYLNFVWDF